jgi:hypothetical protein
MAPRWATPSPAGTRAASPEHDHQTEPPLAGARLLECRRPGCLAVTAARGTGQREAEADDGPDRSRDCRSLVKAGAPEGRASVCPSGDIRRPLHRFGGVRTLGSVELAADSEVAPSVESDEALWRRNLDGGCKVADPELCDGPM